MRDTLAIVVFCFPFVVAFFIWYFSLIKCPFCGKRDTTILSTAQVKGGKDAIDYVEERIVTCNHCREMSWHRRHRVLTPVGWATFRFYHVPDNTSR